MSITSPIETGSELEIKQPPFFDTTTNLEKHKMQNTEPISSDERQWHQNFVRYTEYIVNHKTYAGLFYERGADRRVKWVVTGQSDNGKRRRSWWDAQCNKHGIKIEPGCYATIALAIHPTKIHVCQICGKELQLEYVYPTKNTIAAITAQFGISVDPFTADIFQIVFDLVKTENDIRKLKQIFRFPPNALLSKENLNHNLQTLFVNQSPKGFLSPGAMSNSPDRFDGYHSDGACCRHKTDKGRHKINLQRYGQDRRVYENWADGNWKMADRLMSLFRQNGISADHIGPISLGFCHRPKFHPLTKAANSAKNNRMSLRDVQVLLADEKDEQVVSWHSQFLWDKLKHKVANDKDAVKLSNLMRNNLHHILIVFSIIEENGYGTFLLNFLNPQYSFFDYQFEGFTPETGTYETVVTLPHIGKNQQNNVDRYYRVALEELKEYREIENRKTHIWTSNKVSAELKTILVLLNAKRIPEAKAHLDTLFQILAGIAEDSWNSA